jgi:hypothetical protein
MKITKRQLKQIIKEELRESLEDRLGGPEGGDPEWRVEIPSDPEELRDFLDGIAKSIEKMSPEEFATAAGEPVRAFLRISQVLADADPSRDPNYR